MSPWVVYGQTAIPAYGALDNPAPNLNGLLGEVTLPYTVPAGKILVLTGWGFEGLPTAFGVCIPWIGSGPITNAKCLPSVGPALASYYITGTNFQVPAGKIVNVRLLNGTSGNNFVCAWMMQGYLMDVPATLMVTKDMPSA